MTTKTATKKTSERYSPLGFVNGTASCKLADAMRKKALTKDEMDAVYGGTFTNPTKLKAVLHRNGFDLVAKRDEKMGRMRYKVAKAEDAKPVDLKAEKKAAPKKARAKKAEVAEQKAA